MYFNMAKHSHTHTQCEEGGVLAMMINRIERRRFKATPPTVFRGRSKYKTQIFFCFVHTHARTADTRTRASNPLKRRKINYWSYINEHNTTNDITETRCTVARGLLKKNNSNYKIDSIFLYIRAKKQVNKNTISQYFDGTR